MPSNKWRDRQRWGRKNASEILNKYWDGYLPVDPVAIAEQMGLPIYQQDLGGNISGKLEMTNGEAMIFVDDEEQARRARFTIAHELGHYMDHEHEPDVERIDRRDGTSNPEEFGCNEFAGALLMPERQFRDDVAAGLTDRQLAWEYQVNPAAVKVRKETLGL